LSTETKTANGIKLVGEAIVPGASQLIDGNIRSGGLHLLGGAAAAALLGGPTGVALSLLVRGNSFTSSTLGKPLYRALFPGGNVSDEDASKVAKK